MAMASAGTGTRLEGEGATEKKLGLRARLVGDGPAGLILVLSTRRALNA